MPDTPFFTLVPDNSFHGYYDHIANTAQPRETVTVTTRKLSYSFHTHFHPYAAKLVSRLVKDSLRGLQEADTDYLTNPDGTLKPLADSMQVALTKQTEVTLIADGRLKLLPSNMRVMLPDSTGLSLKVAGNQVQMQLTDTSIYMSPAGDTSLTIAGSVFVTFAGGTQVTVNGKPVRIPNGTEAVLLGKTNVTLSDGTQVTIPANTTVNLLGGLPKPVLYEGIFSSSSYIPSRELVPGPDPVKELDFTSGGAYAVYNWELFYHVPLTMAVHLSKNQRFEDAQRWFHYIFDPTDNGDGPTPERFWKVKPFQKTDVNLIEEILINLSTGDDLALQRETIDSIQKWKDTPFRPHVVARYRQSSYMFKTVMAYLDNLIAWGDSLFRQDTIESINEATQVYILAADILGARPQLVPKKGSVRPQTYANLRANLDEIGNTLVNLETEIPFDGAPHPSAASDNDRLGILRSLGSTPYFCIPRNDKLLSYWDTVADRLFKIHNSLNIQGVFRQLPLFEPPIDPALLARAVAAGIDVGATVTGANQPLTLVRFQFLVQKALEICQEVKSLGNNLLAAMEKEDNEALAILRARHERVILGLTETVRYAQWQEAIKTREGLEKSLVNAAQRYSYYERLLGKQESEIKIPELDALDTAELQKMKLKAEEPSLPPREVTIEIGSSLLEGGHKLNPAEAQELDLLEAAQAVQDLSAALEATGALLSLVPDTSAHATPVGVGAAVRFGGTNLGHLFRGLSSVSRGVGARLGHEAGRASKMGSYTRREQEWAFQSNLAAGEITQILKQLRAAQIRESIAEREWKNHQQQIKHAEEIELFLSDERNGKKTNQAFYGWMKREVKGLYGQSFQFAFDIARKSERALQHELGSTDLSFLQYGYLAGKEGLLGGEKLYLDIRRMELAYHELNQREYELTKHVSLMQVDPKALLQLRITGRCTVLLPEELFDMDGPGHYFRRIRSVAASIPCVTGPYTSVNCTLTLLKSSIRRNPLLRAGSYARQGMEDDRFSDHFGTLQAIVTSGGQSDSGLFETNFRDERYLPFEGSGVVSQWQLELPAEIRQFDYNTIADVILHFRYTAREGGELLRNAAAANLTKRIEAAEMAGSMRLFLIRQEFPTAWAMFKSVDLNKAQPKVAKLTLELREEHYPFWSRGRLGSVKQMDFFARAANDPVNVFKTTDLTNPIGQLKQDPIYGGLYAGKLAQNPIAKPFDEKLSLYLSDNKIQDLWLAVTWGK